MTRMDWKRLDALITIISHETGLGRISAAAVAIRIMRELKL